MNLALCVLALGLLGADDTTPAKAAETNTPATRQIESKAGCPESELRKEIWPLALREAIRIGLDNGEIVRVLAQGNAAGRAGNCFGPPGAAVVPPRAVPVDLATGLRIDRTSIAISRLNADLSIHRFKSEVMAKVRSIEEQYWKLAAANKVEWAADQAVNVAQDVVELERSDLSGHSNDVAEMRKRLEEFQKALAERKNDGARAERQLRKLLGLPEADGRLIMAVDQPIKKHVVFDWDTCLEATMQNGPDIMEQDALTNRAEQKLTEARKAVVEAVKKRENRQDGEVGPTYLGFITPVAGKPVLANTRQLQNTLLRSQEFRDQVVQQTTRSLTRAIGEVENGYELYAKAKNLRNAAEGRLKAQGVYYDEGRVTAERFLDAIEQYATLVANENHHLAAYNSALTRVGECTGTLLEDRNLVVVERCSRAIGAR